MRRYHNIEEKYYMEYVKLIKDIQETGIVKVRLKFQDDRIGETEGIEACLQLCRNACIALEQEKKQYEKQGIASLFNKKKRKTKIAEIEKRKMQFVEFTNFCEILKIFNGKIFKNQLEISKESTKQILYLKFEEEKDAIQFALIFFVVYPECIIKEWG